MNADHLNTYYWGGFLNRIPMNVPNIITLGRFLFVPAVTILIYFDMMLYALVVYIVACATDLLDGYIARKYHLITNEGALLDPLADKLMAIFAIVSFTITGVLPLFVLIIILIKELLMISGGIFLYFKDIVSPSNMFGKIAAFTFNTSIAFTFLYKIVTPWHIYFISFALLFMMASLFQYAYFNLYKKFMKKDKLSG
jgi:cardiolipin synthase